MIRCLAWLLAVLLCLSGCEQPARSAVCPLEEGLGSASAVVGECRVYCIFAESDAVRWTLTDAARATELLMEAADYLEAQCARQGSDFFLKYPTEPDGRYITQGHYGGDFAGNGEDGMLIAAAAEAWRAALAPPAAGEQAVYLVLINGPGQSYALPQLHAAETDLYAETAVLYMQGADAPTLAAVTASLFTPRASLFSGDFLEGENFSKDFIEYLGFSR